MDTTCRQTQATSHHPADGLTGLRAENTLVRLDLDTPAPSTLLHRFEEPQRAWKPAAPWNPNVVQVHLTRTEDALRVTLTERTRNIEDQP